MWHAVLIGLSVPILMILTEKLFRSQPIWLRMAPVLIWIAFLGMALARFQWRKTMPGLTRILVEEGICAGCTYPLEGLAENADGMLVCPECSAAWRRDRVIRFAPIARNATSRTVRGEVSHFLWQMRKGADRRGIRDDRDSPRAVIAFRTIRKVRAAVADDHRARIGAAVKIPRPKGRLMRLAVAGLFILVVVIIIDTIQTSMRMGGRMTLAFIPLAFVALFQLVMIGAILFSDFGRASKIVRREFLKHDLCPCCAADLLGRTPESDGCTTCPDCSAAWRYREPDPADSAPTPPPFPSAAAVRRTPPSA